MRKYGLIGYPLGHSFSKKYFSLKFISEKINDCSYENYPLDSLDKFFNLVESERELSGLNVTIPYKSEIIRFLNYTDSEACEIGAVNVIKISRSFGEIKLSGYNSDVTGIEVSLRPYLNKKVTDALVLGTGGSSRAVCYVLKKLGVNVTLVSRSEKAGTIPYSAIDKSIIESIQLIVNTTPLGMYPNTNSLPEIDYKALSSDHILFDLVYNPEMTSFLLRGKEQGCSVIGGIKMLHAQAEKAWEIWNDDNLK
jgi:shikimate dehydrogenase